MMGTGAVFQHDCVHFSPFIATFSGYADFFQLPRFFSDHNPSSVGHETGKEDTVLKHVWC